MTYTQKLKDPRWQKKRLEIFERDGFQCQHCNSTTKTLNAHHLAYLGGIDPWEARDDELITLCEECHKAAEERRWALCNIFGLMKPEVVDSLMQNMIRIANPGQMNQLGIAMIKLLKTAEHFSKETGGRDMLRLDEDDYTNAV